MPGCGNSQDDMISINHEIDDLNTVINYCDDYKHIIICGHSMGSSVSLELINKYSNDKLLGLVLSGVPTNKVHYDWSMYYSNKQLNDLNTLGYLIDERKKTYKIAKETIDYFYNINQEKLLSNLKIPVYLINGDSDYEEKMFVQDNIKAVNIYPNVFLNVIKGAGHSFKGYEDDLKVTIVNNINIIIKSTSK